MDDRLQDLRRRAAQGDDDAHARLLVELTRRGAARHPDGLDLALALEHAAAARALGRRLPPSPTPLAPWIAGLARWGAEPVVVAALAAGRVALAAWQADDAGAAGAPLQPALSAAQEWFAVRSAEARALLAREAQRVIQLADGAAVAALPPPRRLLVEAVRWAVACAHWTSHVPDDGAAAVLSTVITYGQFAVLRSAAAVGEAPVREAVRADVLAWEFPA